MTLEEAWTAIRGPVEGGGDVEEVMDQVRAGFLAVLEEAAAEEGNPFPLEGEGYDKLKRRIEALP